MTDELKPCPFCGSAMESCYPAVQHPGGECILADFVFLSEVWNRRALPQDVRDALVVVLHDAQGTFAFLDSVSDLLARYTPEETPE